MTVLRNPIKHFIQLLSKGYFIYKFPSGKNVYLTFDDGPDVRYTSEVLDILFRFSAKSTFFLVGKNAEIYPKIVTKIKADGHAIGLHTYKHKRLDRMSKKEFEGEVIQNQQAIEAITGEKPVMIRPPQGKVSLTNLLWAMRDKLRIVHFTITSNDWKANSAFDVEQAIRIDEMNGGEIICFHDNNQHTVEALPVLLENLMKAGYSCVPISLERTL